ncbi:unnamed protein product, partial [Haemonchus placei]|uniref:Peptidase A2 domain-containing protein n=1 Tax=Haemonchus placei TaxID=6290 RepID=A0A0N4X8E8_HAEPC
MSRQQFMLKNAKQRLTRQLNALTGLLEEAREFEEPWNFPNGAEELDLFIVSKDMIVKNLVSKLSQRKDDISNYYAECNQSIFNLDQEEKEETERQFDDYWLEKEGENLLYQAENVERQLEIRLLELQCQAKSGKRELKREEEQEASNELQSAGNSNQQAHPINAWTMERRLLGNELKVPHFHGKPSEFDSFWELFEELVHKQPYSNIEKLSILLNSCKGDAARTLQMIPRTGESYEKAVNQLKSQYQDPRRIIMQMIKKLKSMRQCQDDHRSLRNNLSDIQAIIATLEKQGEEVNTTNLRTMVLETFSKAIQDEMAKKEFDSGNIWTMDQLLDNLAIAIKRKEHVDSVKDPYQGERSIFHTSTTILPKVQENSTTEESNDEFANTFINSSNVRLMIVPVQIQSSESQEKETVLALLDSASDQSFISTSLARRKNLKTQNETTILVNTFGGRAEKRRAKRVITSLFNREGDHIKVELLTNDTITPPLNMGSLLPEDDLFIQEHFPTEEWHWISRTTCGTVVPELLIGMDYFNAIMQLHTPVIRLPSGLFLTSTFFGLVVSGVPDATNEQTELASYGKRILNTYMIFDSTSNHMDISELWKLNTVGIEDMSTQEEVNDQIVADFYSTVQVKDNKIFDNLYVDNVLLTDDSTQSLIEKYKSLKQVFNNMSMNLRQFITNDDYCNKSIALKDLSTSKSIKILGIPWNHQKDTFHLKCKLRHSSTLTKRKVLQATHSTFDPLGLLIPLLLPAKFFLQDLWKGNYKWDEELPPKLKCEWQSICENAAGFETTVPRALTDLTTNNRYEIHTFVDASIRAFAAVAYLRTINEDADCATKGANKTQMSDNIWWYGPPFLLHDNSRWPQLPEYSWTSNGNEADTNYQEISQTVLATNTEEHVQQSIFLGNYSSFKKYKRVLALVMKFLKFTIFNKLSLKYQEKLKKTIPELEKIITDQPLTSLQSIDLTMAERRLIKWAQQVLSHEKLAKLSNLRLYMDENGIMRCRGRIQAKHLARETQEPILLPENHNFTNLIIQEIHRRCGHQGVNGTLANIRLNYWIPKGRQTVKK